jgi:hypothetical protein
VISLHQKLNQLSLTSMARQLDQVMADAAARNLRLAQTLESLADLELEARNSRSIERRFRISRLEYHALLASVQHRFSQGFTLLANYTYSHCISDLDFNDEISASVFQNPSNLRQDRGACIFDARHLFNASVIATSPKVGGKLTSAILGNWQLAPIISAHTGLPMNVTNGTDNSRSGVGLDRPNLALPNAYNSVWGRSLQFLNAAAFQPNAVGTFGNLGRDALFGPGLLQLDAALSRLFSLSERYRLEARFEALMWSITPTSPPRPQPSAARASAA